MTKHSKEQGSLGSHTAAGLSSLHNLEQRLDWGSQAIIHLYILIRKSLG